MNETSPSIADTPVIEWIRSAAIRLTTAEPRHGWHDLEPFRKIIGDARILSLGEATHGTREFFTIKHRLLEYCVAELGFTTFIIEASFPESLAVNAYVRNGTGNAADTLAGMRFWVWDTEEVLDLIEWMRWWNLNNRRKVSFYGFAMAYPAVAAQGLIDFLERVEPAHAVACASELAPLTSDFTADLFGQLPQARREALFATIARVLGAFAEHRSGWIAATSLIDWHLGRLHAVVLDQGARFSLDGSMALHERMVAENVCALLEAEGPGAKAVLWSHNVHAARASFSDGGHSMGKVLDARQGRGQVVVGFSFDRGSFHARTYPTGELADHSVSAAAQGTFDFVLAQAGQPMFALDLANAPREGAAAAWLASETRMRSIGGIYGFPSDNELGVTYADMIIPREHFDAVIFVAETHAARSNRPADPTPKALVLPAPTNLELAGNGVPTGWQTFDAPRKYAQSIAVCEEPSPGGGRTVRISRDAPWRWGDVRLIQKISARAWQKKQLQFTATIRTMVTGAGNGALLFMEFLSKPDEGIADFFLAPLAKAASNPEPVQSPHWTRLTVEASVLEAADILVLGLVLTGNGTAWFGDLEFTENVPSPASSRT